jgi:alginate O-acetyltransferase complex protein AlgI
MWQLDWTKLADILTYDPRQPMIFSSGLFLFLFLGFSLIYALLQKRTTARLLFVSAFSYYFYYKSSGVYFFLLGVVSVSDYLLAARMARTETLWKHKTHSPTDCRVASNHGGIHR